jgi:hypothetical protein
VIAKCSSVLATMVIVLGSFSVAEAENVPNNTGTAPAASPPTAITSSFHNAMTHSGQVKSGGSKTGAGTTASAAPAPAAAGWFYAHATTCVAYYDGSKTWLYLYPQEGGVWWTDNLTFQNTLEPQCSQGNWVAFYVYNTNGNLWNQVYTFNFK